MAQENDELFDILGRLGYTGSLNDRYVKYFKFITNETGSYNDLYAKAFSGDVIVPPPVVIEVEDVGRSAFSVGQGSTVINLPVNPQAGDLILLAMVCDRGLGDRFATGYTNLYQSVGAEVSASLQYKISDGTETNITIPATAQGRNASGYLLIARDVDTSTPFVPTFQAQFQNTTDTSTVGFLPVTTTVNGSLIVAIGGMDDDSPNAVTTYPTDFINGVTSVSGAPNNNNATIGAATFVQSTAGEITPGNMIFSGSDHTHAITIAIKPREA